MEPKARISNRVKFLFWLTRFLETKRGWLITLASGFLLGRVTNEMSVPKVGILDVLQGTFSIAERPTNVLSWLSVILLVIVPVGYRILARQHKKQRYDKLFALLVRRHRARAIAPYNALAWDEALSLQTCPELHRGWPMSEIRLSHDTTRFSLPEEYRQAYIDYFEKYKQEKRFFDDGVKLMITRNPTSFSDSPTLILHTQETLYSQIQFYRDNVVTIASKRDTLIRAAVEGPIHFPHSLCMHMIVVTRDDKVLITKRSGKVSYHPNTWSCSVEEQFSTKDLQSGESLALLKCAERLLFEELGLTSEEYDEANLRTLSLFLESDILGVSLCAHAVLKIDSSELGKVLLGLPRTDYEFTEWAFLSHEELLNELFRPSRPYHPTSGYRMLMALIRRFGEPIVAEKFLREQ